MSPRVYTCQRCHGAGELECTRGGSRNRVAACGRCRGTGTTELRPRGEIAEELTPVSNRALRTVDGREL